MKSLVWSVLVLAATLHPTSCGGLLLAHDRATHNEETISFQSVAHGDDLHSGRATRAGLDAPAVVIARTRAQAECLVGLLNTGAAEQVTEQIKKVDFNLESVVAVVRGRMSSGGFGIRVERISRAPEGVSITVRLTNPDPRVFQQQNMPHPFHIVRVPREEVDVAIKGTWIVRTVGGQLLTSTGVAASCPPSNNRLQPTPR
jgi:hypothetical protein